MKAAVIHRYGGPEVLIVEELPDPQPAPGEVLVRVSASSVNPFDYKLRSGVMKDTAPLQFPAVLGVDLSGVVETIGQGITGFAAGEQVFAHVAQGAYAQFCSVKASDLAKLPEGIDLAEAAALPTVVTTGAQLARLALGNRSVGGTVLVTGAVGNVGRSAAYFLKDARATVIAGVLKRQFGEAKQLGVDRIVALDDTSDMASLSDLDAVADTVFGDSGNSLLAKVRSGGIFASVIGVPSDASAFPQVSAKTMQTAADPALLVKLATAYRDGNLTIPIGRTYALASIGEAHAAAEGGAKGKILIAM